MKVPFNFYRHFSFGFLFLVVGLALCTILVNWIVDPYDLYGMPQIEHFNKIKIEVEKQCRLFRAIDIARQKPKAILLGTSRVMGGFNPDDLTAIIQEYTYNAGAAGASFEEIYRYFEHALYHQSDLKVIVLGLDLFTFSENKKFEHELIPERLRFLPQLLWKDIYTSLFTKSALIGSYQTIKENFLDRAYPIFLKNGQYNPLLLTNEHNPLLVGGDLDFIKRMFTSSILYRGYKLDNKKIEFFEQMVHVCRERGIRLEVFICPSKAIYWEALYRKGLGRDLEQLKQRLSAIHPIWDFSGFNSVTTQATESKDPYYFECSHFRPYVGKLILDKMFKQAITPPDFGYLLNPKTVEAILIDIQKQRQTWIQQHPEIITELDQITGL